MDKLRVIIFGVALLLGNYRVKADDKPALIPMPRKITWEKGEALLAGFKFIVVKDRTLQKEAVDLQQRIKVPGHKLLAIKFRNQKARYIQLAITDIAVPQGRSEAYRLKVGTNKILLSANTPEGIFRGVQTLSQLVVSGKVKACTITDYPAYSWRGYMVDVGRNFQSIEQLKQQIDIMSRYKLNVFHLHLTEDAAWRLQLKTFPQLTDSAFQLRDKGKYYSIDQIKDLIKYCRDRFITFVPEIDMPGHSGAFTRAMGTGMQTEAGLKYVRLILQEICDNYAVPYIHIGADEVVIRNKEFLPEVITLLQQNHKKVIGWAPGGNYNQETIQQLWKDEEIKPGIKYIDSRSLYISDMDPLNTVVTIFERRLGDRTEGDSSILGAEFCVWNDRKVNDPYELISKNAVYPAMLAFAERSWCGGGNDLAFNIGADTSARAKAFTEFEGRLLNHKRRYFAALPFTYVKQTDIRWKLLGPFDNQGDLSTAFWPERRGSNLADSAGIPATGGTVWLWHTNSPAVKAWLPSFRENTTWYAFTNFYSATDQILNFWIDFKDQSRSGADATPPAGAWDYKQSRIWLNGKVINPPQWKYPGRPRGQLEEPLTDETFYYRKPVALRVRKGWNKVLVKLPIDNFNKKDWQVPPKWMFTFIPVHGRGTNLERLPLIFNPNYPAD